jgi:hypothetical protein
MYTSAHAHMCVRAYKIMYIEAKSTSSDSVRQVRSAIRDHARALAGAYIHVFVCICGCVTWGTQASAFTHKNRKKAHSGKSAHSYHIFISIYKHTLTDFTAVQTDALLTRHTCTGEKSLLIQHPSSRALLRERSRRAESREEGDEAGRGSRGRGGSGKAGGGTILPHLLR